MIWLRYSLIALSAFAVQTLLFLALPLLHALFFAPPERAKTATEAVYEIEQITKKPPEQKIEKTLRSVQRNLNFDAPSRSPQRAFAMDLSLEAGSGGDGVTVAAGGLSNVVYEAGDVDEQVEVLHSEPAKYPARAEREAISGFVRLFLVVDQTGKLTTVQVLEASPPGYAFEREAEIAIRKYQFRPAKINKVPVSQKLIKEFEFVP
jgi:protein TonB